MHYHLCISVLDHFAKLCWCTWITSIVFSPGAVDFCHGGLRLINLDEFMEKLCVTCTAHLGLINHVTDVVKYNLHLASYINLYFFLPCFIYKYEKHLNYI